MTRRWSVGGLLGVILVANMVIVLLVGLVGSLSVLGATRSVTFLSDDLAPAVRANDAVLDDLLNAETYLRGYIIAADTSSLANFRGSVARLARDARPLDRYAGTHGAQLRRLVADEHGAWRAWLTRYADGQARAGGGRAGYDPKTYTQGVVLFDEIRSRYSMVADHLGAQQTAARQEATRRLHATLILIVLCAVLGALILLLLSGWIADHVRRPLRRLAAAVTLLADGEHEERADVAGPREIHRVAVAVNDLAEENSRARALEGQIQAHLREVDNAKTDFVSNVSHELRTPLTIITGYLELLEEDLEEHLDERRQRMLEVTRRNVLRLRELIEDLLALTQAEASSTDLEQVDVSGVVADVAKDMRLAATASQVTLSLDPGPPEELPVLADASQLHRAVLNLVSNAVKFSPAGSDVRLSAVRRERTVEVTVADSGMGIPAAELSKLGSRFYRASNAVTQEIAGTGLGLRIVQTIVESHDGSLEIESVEGQGTTAVIRLPLRGGHAAGDSARPGEESHPVPG